MALVKTWKSELSTMTADDLTILVGALETLIDWEMFEREFKGIKEIKGIAVEALLKA